GCCTCAARSPLVAMRQSQVRMPGSDKVAHLFFGGWELLPNWRFENLVRERKIDVSDGIVRFGVRTAFYPAAGDQHGQAVALMWIGLGVLVHVHAAGVIEKVSIALGCGLHALQEVRKFLDVPAGDVAQNTLLLRRAGVVMRVIMMP